ncbi:MAG: hypothetical protein PQJ58_02040 [Spirochaetales bacterium]|nr:hypothetical protein [Spirochaetales bacterium]
MTLILLLVPVCLSAQYVPGVKWKKIEKEHIILIFPEELSETATALARRIDEVYKRESLDFNSGRQTRWPLILTTSGMVSNGYVAVPPRRSVWYGTPAAEGLTAMDWYDLLGLHETRHMVQTDSMNMRFIRFLFYIGGEMAQTGGVHLSLPRWFLEGDAVYAETAYSESGRGRDPRFYNQIKVLSLDGEYSYQQFVNRSYKNYYPDRYSFGYLMTAYITEQYGEESWTRIMKTSAALPAPALGLYLGAKKVTGKSWTRLFLDMMEDLKQQWEGELELLELREDQNVLNTLPDVYSGYEVLYREGGDILARRYSLDKPSALIRIREGEEEEIRRLQPFAGASSNGRQVVWTWNRPSLLYEALNWSDLILYDLETGKKKYLTEKSRLLSPAFSPGGDKIAAVHWSREQEGSFCILNPRDGAILREYPIPFQGFPSSPAWSEDEKTLYFLHQNEKGRGILSLDLEKGNFTVLRDYSFETLKDLCVWKEYLIYASNRNGLENIRALNRDSGQEYRLTARPFGVSNPYIRAGDSTLFYSDVKNPKGNVPVSLSLNPDVWILLEEDASRGEHPYLQEGEWTIHSLEKGESGSEEIEDYSLFASGFNIHSWGISPNLDTLTGLRVNVQGASVMGTFSWAAGGEYEINEKTWGAFLDMEWSRFRPVVSFKNAADYRVLSDTELFDVYSRVVLSLPMNMSRDRWTVFFNPAVSSGVRAYLPLDHSETQYYYPFSSGLIFYAVLPGSSRGIQPEWGVYEQAGSSIDPAGPSERYRHYSQSFFYTPGFFRNTGFRFGLAGEQQSGDYSLSVPFARGYESSVDFRTLKISGDYDFPIAYPDGGGGSFFYIRRVRGNFFYDHLLQGDLPRDYSLFRSAGTELTFDMTLANQEQQEFNLGFRFLWLLDEKRPAFQLVFMNASFL